MILRALHEYSLFCMRLKLNETEDELKKDKAELGLSENGAQRENVYGIELPIAICSPFNADFDLH